MAAERFQITGNGGAVDGWGYKLANSGGRYVMAVPDAVVMTSDVFKAHEEAFDALGQLDDAIPAIRQDRALSEFGRIGRIEQLSSTTLANIAVAMSTIEERQHNLDAIEAKALSPGVIEAGDFAGALADMEVRTWFAGQKDDPKVLDLIGKLDLRAQAALMRSPIPIAGPAGDVLRAKWNEAKRAQDPEQHVRIAAGRQSIEWARRGLLQMAGIARMMVGLPAERLLYVLASSSNEVAHRGLHVFGFSSSDVAVVKQRIAADALINSRRAA